PLACGRGVICAPDHTPALQVPTLIVAAALRVSATCLHSRRAIDRRVLSCPRVRLLLSNSCPCHCDGNDTAQHDGSVDHCRVSFFWSSGRGACRPRERRL